jgi:hypothetical protein
MADVVQNRILLKRELPPMPHYRSPVFRLFFTGAAARETRYAGFAAPWGVVK